MTKKSSHTRKISPGKTGWAALALLMLGLAVVAGYHFDQNTTVTAVEFTGHTYTTTPDLQESIDSPLGLRADSVDYNSLYNSLYALPWVKDVSVRMTFRGVLTVEVTEREPIGLLAGVSGKQFFDEDGVLLNADLGNTVDVPLVYGFTPAAPGDTITADGFEEVRNLLVAAKDEPFAWSTISEVAWSSSEGVVALSSDNGVKLLFGRYRFDEKVTYWKEFNRTVVAKKGIDSFRLVDLRFRNQIVTDEI